MIVRLLRKIFKFSTIGPALDRYYILPRIKLHRIHSSDKEWHTHPWNGISIIFGMYREMLDKVANEEHSRWFFNRIYANRYHKVIVNKPVWTLFIHGKRINENWRYGDEEKPWEGSDQERHETT